MTLADTNSNAGPGTKLLIAGSFLVGLYVPTSIDGSYSTLLWGGVLSLFGLGAFLMSFRRDGIGSTWCVLNSLLLIMSIVGGSSLSPFPEYHWGGLLPYIALALMYVLNLGALSAGPGLGMMLTIANIINVAAGAEIILHNSFMDAFLVAHYSTFYPELVTAMTQLGKPVLTFGSHSTAAFFFYIFFLLNIWTFSALRRYSYLVFAICYVWLGFALFSLTGVALMSVATVQTIVILARKNWRILALAVVVIVTALGLLIKQYSLDLKSASDAFFVAEQAAASSDVNGLSGRFSELGTLYTTVKYIQDRPFSPVGVGYRDDLFFGDSGPVEYYLRGSVLLVFSMYAGLFFFLKRNLMKRLHFVFLFVIIMAFELGFSSLTYIRFLWLLPIIVIYLNDLSRREVEILQLAIPV